MAENGIEFDPTILKKKKKKLPFNVDPLEASTIPISITEETISENNIEQEDEEIDFVLNFDVSKKKKKKKKVSDRDCDVAESSEKTTADFKEEEDTIDVDFGKMKKKKKKKVLNIDELCESVINVSIAEHDNDEANFDYSALKKKKKNKKVVTESEIVEESGDLYTYEEMLDRIYGLIRQANPEKMNKGPTKFVMKLPQIAKSGSKKTVFVNFMEICTYLHRIPKHIFDFLLVELGTSGSIDGSNQLVIKGRYQTKHVQNVLKRYIREYVLCRTCRSHETILQKEGRLNFLQCQVCMSKTSVSSIKSGYQAEVKRRAANRAKQ